MTRRALEKRQQGLQRQWTEVQQRKLTDIETAIGQNMPNAPYTAAFTHFPHTNSANGPRSSRVALRKELDTVKKSHTQVSQVLHKQQLFKARLQTPRWISAQGRAWELCGFLARSGWNLSFQAYNVLYDIDSPILVFARRGDLSGVQRLFSEGKATPFDRTENGMTVLDV